MNTNGFPAHQNNNVNIDYVTYRLPNLAAFDNFRCIWVHFYCIVELVAGMKVHNLLYSDPLVIHLLFIYC
jgi:hypothetical protein